MANTNGVYLGSAGRVDFRRLAPPDYKVKLLNEDINDTRHRFSFLGAQGVLLTGDRVRFAKQDQSRLLLLRGQTTDDAIGYVNVETDGGIRMFATYQEALNGFQNDALQLRDPRRDQDIVVCVENETETGFYRELGRLQGWSLTTQRETVDTTSLGSAFRTQYEEGIISGQGALTALWSKEWGGGACSGSGLAPDEEYAMYFCQLLLRVQTGSRFGGRYFVRQATYDEAGGVDESALAVYYQADCIVTNVSFNFAPGELIRARIQFVTSGPISLRIGLPEKDGLIANVPPEGLITQENGDLILQGGYQAFDTERPTWE
jgi:hypothetical protein